MVESVRKTDEKMKPMLRETKKMYREPIVMRRKLGLKSMVWTRRKKHPTRKEERNKNSEKMRGEA